LSHSSIVAREYGIPAVLGTGVATRRIRSEQNIRVDGDAGTVTLLDGMGRDDEGRPAQSLTNVGPFEEYRVAYVLRVVHHHHLLCVTPS
jgi:hypothetical protein